MATKVVRGQVITFIAVPKDYLDVAVNPDSITLYLNYLHADGTASTDEMEMVDQNDGTWAADFDTSSTLVGPLFCSLQATNPDAAEDLKFSIVANAANPAP